VTFDEFERPAPAKTDVWTPAVENADEPSLGYLFKPFDPGKIEPGEFRRDFENLPVPENYEYVQMDTRDTGIVTTLEMANKKASEIVAGAFEQGRRLEEKMLAEAKVDCEELKTEARRQAETQAEEILAKASQEAEGLIAQAQAKVAEIEADKAEAEKVKSETLELNERAAGVMASLTAREAALAPREAEIDGLKDETERLRQGILEQAKKEAEVAKARGNELGLAEGRAKGRELGLSEAKNEVLTKAKGFFQIAGRINGLWQELWQRKAPFMVTLAVEAAEAIVNKEIKDGRGLAAGAFAACVEHLQKCHTATFKVRPEDLQEIEEARTALRDQVEGLVNVVFKPDPSLGPGDIIMESDAGRLDATMKARRERVMAVLRQALEDGLVAELPPEPPQASPPEPPQASPPEPPQASLPEAGGPDRSPAGQGLQPEKATDKVAALGSDQRPEEASPASAVSLTAVSQSGQSLTAAAPEAELEGSHEPVQVDGGPSSSAE
jgi:flagellar biosynthesis/type III secretory pathway protein FliH